MSLTGNTQKVALAIYEALPEEKEIHKFDDLHGFEGYDLIFLGFPIHDFGPPDRVKNFLKKAAKGKRLAMFVTHGAPENMPDVHEWLENCRCAAHQFDIVSLFNCQGEMAEEVIDFIKQSDQPKLIAFARFAHLAKGLPNDKSLTRAQNWALEIMC